MVERSAFQPTLPARGATRCRRRYPTSTQHFNPRSPHGERQNQGDVFAQLADISTHAPRTGSDMGGRMNNLFLEFQPTLPARGATQTQRASITTFSDFNPRSPHGERHCHFVFGVGVRRISTHAPRTGSDGDFIHLHASRCDFNPRSPHGERPRVRCNPYAPLIRFQPTLPARGATAQSSSCYAHRTKFQPTLPARGATKNFRNCRKSSYVFQPTLPARGATQYIIAHSAAGVFQPTLPARGATRR